MFRLYISVCMTVILNMVVTGHHAIFKLLILLLANHMKANYNNHNQESVMYTEMEPSTLFSSPEFHQSKQRVNLEPFI